MTEIKILNNILLLRIVTITLISIAVLALPYNLNNLQYKKAEAFTGLGVPIGGFIDVFVPGYPWTLGYFDGYCPAHVYLTLLGSVEGLAASSGGEIDIILPPGVPYQSYDYITPGLYFVGAIYPFDLAEFFCPYEIDVPLYYASVLGSSYAP